MNVTIRNEGVLLGRRVGLKFERIADVLCVRLGVGWYPVTCIGREGFAMVVHI